MFGRKKDKKPDQPVPNSPEDSKPADVSKRDFNTKISYLSPDSEIKGTIKFSGTMRVDGKVDGKIITDNGELIIGERSTVKAAINIRNAVIEGRVDGNIKATGKVVLKKKARLIGDLQAKTLVVEAGVVFVGRCNVNHE